MPLNAACNIHVDHDLGGQWGSPMKSAEQMARLKLSHLSGSRTGDVELFERESVLIGRGEHNDVVLSLFDDPTVSSQHAEIRFEDEGFVLYDMGSLNGTLLNGYPVRRAELHEGDEIGLGKRGPRILFDTTPPAAGTFRQPKPPKIAPTPDPSTPRTLAEPMEAVYVEPSSRWQFWLAVILLAAAVAILSWKFLI